MPRNGRYVRVKKAHLREDIREAKGMIRELQRGVRRDEKELSMAAKRKKRGLGAIHPSYLKPTSPAPAWMVKNMEALERKLNNKTCNNSTVTDLRTVQGYIESLRRDGSISGVLAGRMENQITRLFNKSCVVKPRR